jgi:hypothetical protein
MAKEWRGRPPIIPDREAYQVAVRTCSEAGISDEHEILLHATTHVVLRLSGAEFRINNEMAKEMKEPKMITVEAVREHNRKGRAEGITFGRTVVRKPPRSANR